jgi:hypothetical protein
MLRFDPLTGSSTFLNPSPPWEAHRMEVSSRPWEPKVPPGWWRPHRVGAFTPSRPMKGEAFASSGIPWPTASPPPVRMDRSGSGTRSLGLPSRLGPCPRPGSSSSQLLPREIGWPRPPARRSASAGPLEPVALPGPVGPTPSVGIAAQWPHWPGRPTVDPWPSPAMAE